MAKKKEKPVTPFSREKWLETALETLAETRKSKFSLDTLLAAMPVTKGSFYNHFKNRHDFLLALVDFWDRHHTRTAISALESLPSNTPPREKLFQLLLFLQEMDLHRYEPLMRSLTLELPEIGEAVKKVDLERYDFLASIFSELGFQDDELDLRVRMFMTVISQEGNLLLDRPLGEWVTQLEKRLDFLIRP